MTDGPAPAPDGRRPLGVIVIALVQFGRAALIATQLLEFNPFPDQDWFHAAVQLPEPAVGTVAFAVSRIIGVGLLAASLIVGLGVLRSRRWAWIGAILMSGLGLAFAIGAWWDGHPQYLAMVINVVAVFYLNQREVRSVFDTGAEDDDASHEHVVAFVIDAADLELLRRHEPILRFTRGELFLPMPTDGYVAACDLLSGPSIREATVVAPAGSLTLDGLGATGDPAPGHLQFLRFVSRPMNAVELARWRNRPDRPQFQAPGRLARVGLPARLVDAGLVTSLLLRGRVPGGTAAAADRRYAAIRERDPRIAYHGRVLRTGGWVVLHYLFFYAMNDWRSTFDGANDHEADWEQCFVVLEELEDGTTRPAWFCAAAHDEKGDDLRRRWDDPRLEAIDGHPVVYPGAGSHAIYLERGEYIMRLPFPGERNLRGPLDLLRRIWRDTLDQPDPGDLSGRVRRAMSVPFVDYARGDGVSVGPGADHEWTPIPISDADPWVDGYRGLWGLDTGDRFAGERAPAGPKYTRTGTVRQSWLDPLGFSGLAKVAPPARAAAVLAADLVTLERERSAVRTEAETLAAELPGRSEQLASLRGLAGLGRDLDERTAAIHADEARLAVLRTRDVELTRVLAAGEARLTALRAGVRDDPRAHLRHAAEPEPMSLVRRRAFGEAWAALSVGMLIVLLAVVVWLRILPAIVALPVLLAGYLAVEAFFDRSVRILLLRIAMVLAIVAAIILAVTFVRELVLLALLGLGLLLIADNLGELRRRAR